jgi:hypothetical protein
MPLSRADFGEVLGVSSEHLWKILCKEEIPTHGSKMVRMLRTLKALDGVKWLSESRDKPVDTAPEKD